MSLRPQEIQRKGIVAGYGNPPASDPQAAHDDDTVVICEAYNDIEYGDWVVAPTTLTDGHLGAKKPDSSTNAAARWLGVAQHSAGIGQFLRVKTAGACAAKVDTGASEGDMLEVYDGSFSARKLTGQNACGRFLKRFAGDTRLAWVMIQGAAPTPLLVHHHALDQNSYVTGADESNIQAPLYHTWKVFNAAFTGDPAPKLALAIGGGSSHGDTPLEGFAWGGVIGKRGSVGWGEIGGDEAFGHQGVLGAESVKGSDTWPETPWGLNRINVRSWAGFNARDRYGFSAKVVGPLRFTWCPVGGNSAGSKRASWWVPAGCDCIVGTTTSDLCDPSIEWWAGTMKLDPTNKPGPLTRTPWEQQWVPQLALERDCCEAQYKEETPPDEGCGPFTNPATLEANAFDVSGAYEDLIPWGYRERPGRLSVLHGVCCHALHISQIWRTINRFQAFVSRVFACIDTRFMMHGWGPCCSVETKTTVPRVACGPDVKQCFDTPDPGSPATPDDPPVTTPGGGNPNIPATPAPIPGGNPGPTAPGGAAPPPGTGYPGYDPVTGKPLG